MDVSSPAGQRPQIGAILVAQDGIVAIIAGGKGWGTQFSALLADPPAHMISSRQQQQID